MFYETDEDEDEKRRRAVHALAARAEYAQQQPPVDMDLRNDPEVLGDQYFARERDSLRDIGAGEGPMPDPSFRVDPDNKLTPEQFEAEANRRMSEPVSKDPAINALAKMQLDAEPDEPTAAPAQDAAIAALARMGLDQDPNPSVRQPEAPQRLNIDAAKSLGISEAPQRTAAPQPSEPQYRDPYDISRDSGPHWTEVSADLMNTGGANLGAMQEAAAKRRDEHIKTNIEARRNFGNDALDREYKHGQIQNSATNARLREAELEHSLHPDRVPISQWQQAQIDMERERNQATGLDRELDNKRADAMLDEQIRAHNLASGDRADAIRAREEASALVRGDRAEREADKAATRQKEQDTEFKTKFAKLTEKQTKQLSTLTELDALISSYEKDQRGIPGYDVTLSLSDGPRDAINALGRGWKQATGQWTPEEQQREADANRIRQLNVELGQQRLRAETGAAAARTEQSNTAIRTGMGATATPAQRREALRIMRQENEAAIARFGDANPRAARAVLEASGIDPSFIFDPDLAEKRRKRLGGGGEAPSDPDDEFSRWTVR